MQQRSEEWFAARLGVATGTRANTILKGGKKAQETLIAEVVSEFATATSKSFRGNEHTRRGVETEPKALAHYQMKYNCAAIDGGYIVSDIHPLIAVSPDATIGINQGGVEIKCPEAAKHTRYLLYGEIEPDYTSQCHWAQMVTGSEWWDFMSYCEAMPEHLKSWEKRITLDAEAMIEARVKALQFVQQVEAALQKLGLALD